MISGYRDPATELRPYLESGEDLLWTGHPRTGLLFRQQDWFMMPFGLFFLGFSLFWMALASMASVFFALFGVPFVLVGFYLTIGRHWADARKRAHTAYGITQRRILFRYGHRSIIFRAVDRGSIGQLTLTVHRDGTGSLQLGIGTGAWPGLPETLELEHVQDVQGAYRLLG